MIEAGLLAFACIAWTWVIARAWYRRKRLPQDQGDADRAYERGILRGLDIATDRHARWIERNLATRVQGFAIRCVECGTIQSNLLPPEDEYAPCRACGHRMPAPLYRGKDAHHAG